MCVRKIAKRDYLASLCLSVYPQGTPLSHRMDFHETWYLSVFRKSVEKIQVSLKSSKTNGYFTWRPLYTSYHISPSSS